MSRHYRPSRPSLARRDTSRFVASRFRLTLEDELDAKREALLTRRNYRNDKDMLMIRHLVWQEREEREAKERNQRELKEKRERDEAERIASLETIHCLPEELMLKIFGMLPLEDLAKSVVPVCQRWSRLGRDEWLWSRATLRYDPLAESPEDFISAILTAPVLGVLEYISDGKATREDVAHALTKGCARVLSLRLLPCSLAENLLWILLDRLADHLEHLELFLTDLALVACIGGMDKLRTLVLHGEISFVSDKLTRLGVGCPLLTELDLGGLRFNDMYRLDVLITDVVKGHAHSLTVLKLPPTAAVLDAVARCSKLKVLAIWITPQITAALLCNSLRDLEQLESLTWRNYDAWLDKAELANFIILSDRFRALKEFRMVDCIDMDDGLAKAVALCGEGLSSLSLHRSELSAPGLAEILLRAHSLVRLDLYKNAFVTAEHLELVGMHLRQLEHLDVRGCYTLRTLGEDVWQRLRDALPALDVRVD